MFLTETKRTASHQTVLTVGCFQLNVRLDGMASLHSVCCGKFSLNFSVKFIIQAKLNAVCFYKMTDQNDEMGRGTMLGSILVEKINRPPVISCFIFF